MNAILYASGMNFLTRIRRLADFLPLFRADIFRIYFRSKLLGASMMCFFSIDSLKFVAVFEGLGHGHLVRVFQIAAHRQAQGDAAYFYSDWFKQF